jgi:tetratricopeptide (TPR) repeat protein
MAIYLLLNAVCLKLSDTATIDKSFYEVIRHRNEQWAWNEYITTLVSLKAEKQKIITVADSAMKLFPSQAGQWSKIIAELQNKPSDTISIEQSGQQKLRQLIVAATESFNKKNYAGALIDFKKAAELAPIEYTNFENTGLSYYYLNDFSKAITWFDKVIQMKTSTDGKAEFFKAMCLIFLRRNEEACPWLKIAQAKNYKDAKSFLAANCGGK